MFSLVMKGYFQFVGFTSEAVADAPVRSKYLNAKGLMIFRRVNECHKVGINTQRKLCAQ